MSKFYGTVQGERSEATRTGHRGIVTQAASWAGCIRVELSERNGVEMFVISMEPWRGSGDSIEIARGDVGDKTSIDWK